MKLIKSIALGAVIAASFVVPSFAQQQVPFEPLDAELWFTMREAMRNLPISTAAHEQVKFILDNMERNAVERARQAKAKKIEDDKKAAEAKKAEDEAKALAAAGTDKSVKDVATPKK